MMIISILGRISSIPSFKSANGETRCLSHCRKVESQLKQCCTIRRVQALVMTALAVAPWYLREVFCMLNQSPRTNALLQRCSFLHPPPPPPPRSCLDHEEVESTAMSGVAWMGLSGSLQQKSQQERYDRLD